MHNDNLQKPDILSVVESHVVLRKAGQTYRGACPFHDERSPSFFVNPQRQSFHCFGCGAHGDAIDFVQRINNCDFRSALRILGMNGKPLTPDPKAKRQRELMAAFKAWRDEFFFRLSDEFRHLLFIREQIQSFPNVSEETAWAFAEKTALMAQIEYKLDLLLTGNKETAFNLFLEDKGNA